MSKNIFNLNMDNNLRIEIMKDFLDNYESYMEDPKIFEQFGGILSFAKLPVRTMKQLIENNFVNLNDTQGDSPSINSFIDFINEHSNEDIKMQGYIVLPNRDDYRVSITGLVCRTNNKEFIDTFMKTFIEADELTEYNGYLRCCYY